MNEQPAESWPWELPVADAAELLTPSDWSDPVTKAEFESVLTQLQNLDRNAYEVIVARASGYTAKEFAEAKGITESQAKALWSTAAMVRLPHIEHAEWLFMKRKYNPNWEDEARRLWDTVF